MKAPQSNIKLFLYTPNRFFVIPNFQRPYSWTTDNIDSFLSDLEEVRQTRKKHFFGSIVYVNDGDGSIIIDGQQRATTVLLMITAIYHIALESPEKCQIIAEQIKDEYLYNKYAKQYGTEENRIKLRAVTTDNEIFEKIFNKSRLTDNEQMSRLYRAYRRFAEYFEDKNNLEDYIEILENFEIVTIILDKEDDNPQRVFESINSTGKPLTDGDKIRNFALMLHTQEKQDHVLEHYWKNIEQTLTDTDKDNITDFFRAYITSIRQSVVKMNAVYPEFKKLFAEQVDEDQSIESLDNFYDHIVRSLEYYKLLRFGIDTNDRFDNLSNVAFIMRYLKIELYTPYAIAVMRYYDEGKLSRDELTEVFEIIKIYFSRRIVCGLLATSVDRLFATLHRDVVRLVEKEDISYLDALGYVMHVRTGQIRMPSDTELRAGVNANSTYNQRTANVNYILAAIDDVSNESALLRQIENRDINLSVEHIMPQTLTDKWRAELGDDADRIHETYLHGLANLTLTGYNSKYSNRSFYDKKNIKYGFLDSPLYINKFVANAEKWGEDEMKKRQEWWAEHLLKIWPFPETKYKPEIVEKDVDLLDDIDLTGKAPTVLIINGDMKPATSWRAVIDAICEYYLENNDDFLGVVNKNEAIKNWFSTDSSDFRTSVELGASGIYLGVNNSTAQKIRIIRELANIFGTEKGELIVSLT